MATDDELLAEIYEHPDDDGPRLVYMDYLLDRGDPRGEFIALQLRKQTQALTPEELRMEGMLFGTHVEAWVPREVRSKLQRAGMRFERGFLAKCELRQSEQPVGSRQLGHPAWRTVHTISAPGSGLGANRVLLEPELAGVRRLQLTPGPFTGWYLRAPEPRAVETLALHWYAPDEDELVAQLCAAKLPALRHLLVYVRYPAALRRLAESELVGQLDHLEIWTEKLWATLPQELRARVRRVTFSPFSTARAMFG